MDQNIKNISIVGGLAIFIFVIVWFFFFRSTPAQPPSTQTTNFGTAGTTPVNNPANTAIGTTNPPVTTTTQNSVQKVFKIADGPIAGATFLRTQNPTTTIARYILQDNGHVFDFSVDVPGTVPRAVSNTTIPGIAEALWEGNSGSPIVQYLSDQTIKTLFIGLPAATSTAGNGAQVPIQIKFLPDNIESITSSPDGKSIAYLLTTSSGVDGFIAASNDLGSRKIFSLPLAQAVISWPSQGTILVQSKAAVEAPGIVFSVNTTSAVVSQLLYANGLTATANSNFSSVVYQTASIDGSTLKTFFHNMASGEDTELPFSPFPKKCIWSPTTNTVLYCAAPLIFTTPKYLDFWYQGVANVADSIFKLDLAAGATSLIATPGSTNDGGTQAAIDQMSISPDRHYLLFIARGDRSLWGVRLTQ